MTDQGPRSRKQRAADQRGTRLPKQAQDRPRRISRREREAKRQRQIRIGVGIAAVAVIAVLLGFGAYDYIIKPRQVLATVDGTRIRREDYWRFRSLELYNQMAQYSQFAQMVNDPQQQQQYQSMALQAQEDFDNVWGSTDVNDQTLQQMIDNQIYVQSLDDFGLTVTDDEVETWALNQFAPAEAPLIAPTVTPTLVPQRAEWATATAQAMQAAETVTPTPEIGTPAAAASPIGVASPQASPIAEASPIVEASPATRGMTIASPEASPIAESSPLAATPMTEATPAATPIAETPAAATPIGSPAATPIASPEPSPTPTIAPDQAIATAEAGWDAYKEGVLDEVRMSTDDYMRLYAKPQLARQKIRDVLTADVGQTADQVRAQHILVATEELANQLYQDVTTGGQDFATVAQQNSTDTSTAPNGGELGWFPRGVMVAPFEEAAFATAAGQIHPPVQTEFGWHIIRVAETEQNRGLTDDQISQLQDSTVNRWLDQRHDELTITSVMEPTPTPVTERFVPPVDAPAPPAPTEQVIIDATPATPEIPAATPFAATPIAATPVAPAATPVAATPIVTIATPAAATPEAATPEIAASPQASPIGSPVASPISSPIVNPLGTPAGD